MNYETVARDLNGCNEAHNDLDKNIYQLENSEQQFKTASG